MTLRTETVNGITMRFADTSVDDTAGRDLPVVLLMHGWPESWFSWRHQLGPLRDAGFRAIAPDMRGFGGTAAPAERAAYGLAHRAADATGLLAHVGARTAALVGHDHGAMTGWQIARLHPDAFPVYAALSVPYTGKPTHASYPDILRKQFGDPREPDAKFNYMLHHFLPDAPADYAEDTRAALLALYSTVREGAAPPLVRSELLYVDGRSEAMWKRVPQPARLPEWISQDEFDFYVDEYEVIHFDETT